MHPADAPTQREPALTKGPSGGSQGPSAHGSQEPRRRAEGSSHR